MASSTFMPFTSAATPWVLPMQPPTKRQSVMTPSVTSYSMARLQVPRVVYVFMR